MLNSPIPRPFSLKPPNFWKSQLRTHKMASRSSTPCWEAQTLSINVPSQAEEWKSFYTRALDLLEALNTDPYVEDQGKNGWRQIKMMFEGEDHQALQTLIDNQTILCDTQQTPALALRAIQSVIKEDIHFWHHWDQLLLSHFCQLPEEGIHALSNRINTLVRKGKLPSEEVKEIIKLMVLQHAIKYHEAKDWIHLQDQTTLTYQSLLAHCKQLEARCEQFQQAQAQGRAHLLTITAASSSLSSLHANTQSTTTHQPCSRCSYSHPCNTCPAFNCECYNCHTTWHFAALCRRHHNNRHPADTPNKRRESRSKPCRSGSHRHSRRSLGRGRQSCRSNSKNRRNISSNHSPSQDHTMRRSPRCGRCSPTPYRHQLSHLISSDTSQTKEGQL